MPAYERTRPVEILPSSAGGPKFWSSRAGGPVLAIECRWTSFAHQKGYNCNTVLSLECAFSLYVRSDCVSSTHCLSYYAYLMSPNKDETRRMAVLPDPYPAAGVCVQVRQRWSWSLMMTNWEKLAEEDCEMAGRMAKDGGGRVSAIVG